MKITQDIRQEVQRMEVAKMEAAMEAKSAEFLEGGGRLYVKAGAGE